MNLACGSIRELFDFLHRCDATELIEATCVDADPHALEYTDQQVNVFPHQATIRLMNDNVVRWAVGGMRHHYGPQDIIYSAGLTDYLDRRLFQALIARCYQHLKPGGALIIGNFTPLNRNPEGAAVHADILAEHEHLRVAPHLLAECFTNGIQVGNHARHAVLRRG